MLPKQNRLTRDKEFDYIFKNGKSSYTDIIGLKTTQNDLNLNRFGIIVSKKVSKKAVVRNKIKRQIRSIIRKIKIKQGYNCLIIALPKIESADFKTIEKSMINNFQRLRML